MNDKILVITQCFSCGSWVCIEKIVEKLFKKKYKIQILGLEQLLNKNKNIRYYSIPFFAYNRYGYITTYSPILGFLWMLPLYFSAIILTLFNNPKIIIYNGLTLGLILSPFFKLLGRKNIIMYHSIISDTSNKTKNILKLLFRFVDLVVVNSTGMRDDLSGVVDIDKLIVNEHYADDIFFNTPSKSIKPHISLKILYSGRIDVDKRCFPLIEFAKRMKNNSNYEFTFVGGGSAVSKVSHLHNEYKHIKYGGYINDKKELAKLYCNSDVVWGFADSTYLCLPAVESLACDTPIIIPKYAAIINKDELINSSLVPASIGWLVDPFDQKDIKNILSKIQSKKEYLGKKCRKYALQHYSDNNLLKTVDKIEKEIIR